MYSSFFKLYIPIILIIIIFSFFTITILEKTTSSDTLTSEFYWPLPGNHNITSPFGKRTSPTTGASSFHSGIDISATQDTPIYSCTSGQVIFADFQGANGYTITIKTGNIEISYSHISPNYIYKNGDIVSQKEIIAHIGPKNVYNVLNNPYKDLSGLPTNRCNNTAHIYT